MRESKERCSKCGCLVSRVEAGNRFGRWVKFYCPRCEMVVGTAGKVEFPKQGEKDEVH